MKEKLVIKNFGPIKSVELELGRMTVLIGEQATGKSTVAKLLAVCRYFSYIYWDGGIVIPSPNESIFSLGLNEWGLTEAIKADSYIYYECKHYSLTVENEVVKIPVHDDDTNSVILETEDVFTEKLTPLSNEFTHLLENLETLKRKSRSESNFGVGWNVPISFFKNDVAKIMDNPFYLPTERGLQSIFSLGKSSIQNISDSLFNQFAQLDQIARLFKKETIIEPLNITYKNIDGKGYIKKNNEERFFSLFSAASGYQSTIPVVLLAKYYSEIRRKNKTFIIEEPELNLFPAAQQKLMQYMVDIVVNRGSSILATTHSPYVLASFNNMLYAYQIGQKKPNETAEIVDQRHWLNPDDVSAYMLLPDGTCENILDTEENMIKAEKIDEVSGILNEQFNALLNIEFDKK
ncbi:MAG TPA: AAA family ATPase [Chitinophagaceae bacterium]|jgi:predicted ATPase